MRFRIASTVAVTLLIASTALGQRGKLSVGDQAPGLDVEQWVKGDETSIESGRVYVVEFWATWCAPCRRSIPHLSELQERYGDRGLTIIGVSSEEPDVVKPFVTAQREKMEYTVVVDRRSSTKRAWFEAAGLRGIPAAFIVDRRSKIAWIGNPLAEDFDSTLDRVMKGRFDPKLEAEAKPALDAARRARNVRNWRMALKHYDEIVKIDSGIFADVALERFQMLAADMKDRQGAYAYARQLMTVEFVDDAEALQMLARRIAVDPKIENETRDLDVALEAAQQALALSGADNPPALAAVAQIHYHRGELDQAIANQRQAYFLVNPKQKIEYRRVLTTYQEAAQRQARN